MAYSTEADLATVAGGLPALLELTDYDGDSVADPDVIELAQAEADEMIDGSLRRLYGDQLPFDPVPKLIRSIAAVETVYRLKTYRRVATDRDDDLHRQRQETLASMQAGQFMPVTTDPYPIGDGGGTPIVVLRDSIESECAGFVTRESLRGFR